jgi:hypothetical protein
MGLAAIALSHDSATGWQSQKIFQLQTVENKAAPEKNFFLDRIWQSACWRIAGIAGNRLKMMQLRDFFRENGIFGGIPLSYII